METKQIGGDELCQNQTCQCTQNEGQPPQGGRDASYRKQEKQPLPLEAPRRNSSNRLECSDNVDRSVAFLNSLKHSGRRGDLDLYKLAASCKDVRPHWLPSDEQTPSLGIPIIKRHKHYPDIIDTYTHGVGKNQIPMTAHNDCIYTFFCDDFRFHSIWEKLPHFADYCKMRFAATATPDFSVYADFPLAVNITQFYKSAYCGMYWQKLGLTVIPTIMYGDESTFDIAFSYIEKGSHVIISELGHSDTGKFAEFGERHVAGIKRMIEVIDPEIVYTYGQLKYEEVRSLANFVELPTRSDRSEANRYLKGTRKSSVVQKQVLKKFMAGELPYQGGGWRGMVESQMYKMLEDGQNGKVE